MADRRAPDSGVTLIEILVVLTLIAVSAGVVTLALPGTGSQTSLAQQAELLAARLTLAADRSLVEGRQFRFEWEPGAYRFREWAEGAWQPLTDPAFAGQDTTALQAALTDQDGSRRGHVRITPDLMPPARGVLEIALSSGANRRTVLFDGLAARVQGGQP